MDFTGLGLAGLGFWLALAAIGLGFIWSSVKKQQMKHEMTLKLLEKGQGVDQELLAKLLASDKLAVAQKSIAEQHREGGGVAGFLFLVAGLILAAIGIMGSSELVPVSLQGTQQAPGTVPMMAFESTGPNWLLVGLGVFSFLFGYLAIRGAIKEYEKAKAEEKLPRD